MKATILDYVLRSWSLVKIGTTGAQKKLFFGLRREMNKALLEANAEMNFRNGCSACQLFPNNSFRIAWEAAIWFFRRLL